MSYKPNTGSEVVDYLINLFTQGPPDTSTDPPGDTERVDEVVPQKQVIVIRRDLKMRQGKAVAQGAHGRLRQAG